MGQRISILERRRTRHSFYVRATSTCCPHKVYLKPSYNTVSPICAPGNAQITYLGTFECHLPAISPLIASDKVSVQHNHSGYNDQTSSHTCPQSREVIRSVLRSEHQTASDTTNASEPNEGCAVQTSAIPPQAVLASNAHLQNALFHCPRILLPW